MTIINNLKHKFFGVSGDVKCKNVDGSVKTVSGDISNEK